MRHIKLFEAFLNEGRGNTRIRFESENYPTYYVEYYKAEEPEDEDSEILNDTFVDDVVGNISGFKTVELTKLDKPESMQYPYDNQTIYFENDIIKVVFADNEWSMAIGCIPVFSFNDEDEETYDEKKFKDEATKFFTELATMYQLHKASSAWTSSKVDKIEIN
jgi:hypothetical protein